MNMKRRQVRSDFADELIVEEQAGQGYVHTQKKGRSIHVSHICVQDADNPLQKPPGDYISISFASLHDRLQRTELIDALLDHLALLMNAAEGSGSSTLVQSFKKVKNFKSPLFIDDLKFFCCQVLKFYVACVVCVAPLLYNILEVFDHETLV